MTRTKAALIALLMVVMMVTALGMTAIVDHVNSVPSPASCTVGAKK